MVPFMPCLTTRCAARPSAALFLFCCSKDTSFTLEMPVNWQPVHTPAIGELSAAPSGTLSFCVSSILVHLSGCCPRQFTYGSTPKYVGPKTASCIPASGTIPNSTVKVAWTSTFKFAPGERLLFWETRPACMPGLLSIHNARPEKTDSLSTVKHG